MQLSDHLNDLLDFGGGEDFGKMAEEPPQEGDELCKTDKTNVARWLDFVSDAIAEMQTPPLALQEKARLMRNLAAKLRRQKDKR